MLETAYFEQAMELTPQQIQQHPLQPGTQAVSHLTAEVFGAQIKEVSVDKPVHRRNPFMTSGMRPRGTYGDGYPSDEGLMGSAFSGAVAMSFFQSCVGFLMCQIAMLMHIDCPLLLTPNHSEALP